MVKDTRATAVTSRHDKIERNVTLMTILILIVVSIGGLVEIAPLFWFQNTIEKVEGMRPYTPLELAGRNIYMREGCYLCHSQMIRPFRDEVARYGYYSLAAESMYDHPFQWGSKRTGPDLARVGGKYSNAWHVEHLINPQSVVEASIMPKYAFLLDKEAKLAGNGDSLVTLRSEGVPYTDEDIAQAEADLKAQADPTVDKASLLARYPKAVTGDFDGNPDKVSEMDAMLAYLQMLGTLVDFKTYDPVANER